MRDMLGRIMEKGYKTISAEAKASFTERRSEFIGYIAPVSTDEEAVAFIGRIRAEHRKATHNVYAYIVRNGNMTRYSDDGEPQGTAGAPVLDVLIKEGLTDVCCVATRYFGGILLGGGGLVRAYSHTAKIAVEAAQIKLMEQCCPVSVTVSYDLYGRLMHSLPDEGVKVTGTDFGGSVTAEMLVREDICAAFAEKITDLTNGSAVITRGEPCFCDMS